ncbi:MAG: MoxR family ATPase [Deltaproteobacteria bacterium]|nr:MoxR family ATPase [Deltaproteobacteria bacterium]
MAKIEYVKKVSGSITQEMKKVIVGQDGVIELMLVGLFARGHILMEGVPGIAKTLMVKTLAKTLNAEFKRIQFTPDCMPSDVIGTNIFDLSTHSFKLRKGPVFTNLLLTDEINRTPPKTQAALLEAMEERQVSLDGSVYSLLEPFMVLATQNPIEYEGTYPLPEAQLDRFMLKVLAEYPTQEEEQRLLKKYDEGFDAHDLDAAGVKAIADSKIINKCQKEIQKITVGEEILSYITQIVKKTRESLQVILGASPRASVALLLAAKTLAGIRGKEFVTPDEVKTISYAVLRHRLILKPEAEIEGMNSDTIIQDILSQIEVPR